MGQLSGIEVRHRKGCAGKADGRCGCRPAYQASVWSATEQKRIRKTFPTLAAARAWRADAQGAVRRGTMRAPAATTVREAATSLVAGMRSGGVRTRSGDPYKPSVIRGYESALERVIVPALGAIRLGDVQRRQVQRLADQLLADGRDASTIRNDLMPLRVIFRRAAEDGDVAVNPCAALRLPAVRGRRERIASPEEARQLLAVLKPADRALWATAMYAGLRRGELLALRWADVDLAGGLIRVERSFDPKDRVTIEPKTVASRRTVPIIGVLCDILASHRAAQADVSGLVFGASPTRELDPAAAWRRAHRVWQREDLHPIGLHEARHTFASMLIASGVNAKAIATFMGHASIQTTYDLYGKLMPGSVGESAALVDAFIGRADTAARLDQIA